MKGIALIGAGGHAKVIISTLRSAGREVSAIFDDDLSLRGSTVLGVSVRVPVAHPDSEEFDGWIIGIGNNRSREKISRSLDLPWTTAVSQQAHAAPGVKIGIGSVVFAGATIQPDAIIGDHVIVNTGATVDHDCVLEDFVHVGPGVHLAGNVVLETGAFVGIGAVIIPGKRVGRWTTVGAGSVVLHDLGPQETVYGVPAKSKKGGAN